MSVSNSTPNYRGVVVSPGNGKNASSSGAVSGLSRNLSATASAMIAPKPLLLVAASVDQSFPIAGVREVFAYGQSLYRSYGAPDRIAFSEDSTAGHGYQQKKREAAYGWFLRWLKGTGDGSPHPEPPTETAAWDSADLRCFPPGENQAAGPAMVDLLGGQIHLIFATAASSIGHIKAGKIRALAVTTAKRSALVPDLPTVAESGLPGFEANNWNGFFVPAKTPRPIINRLNKELTAVLAQPDIKETLFNQGLDAAPSTPEDFGAYLKSEMAKWAKVIKAAGIKPQ